MTRVHQIEYDEAAAELDFAHKRIMVGGISCFIGLSLTMLGLSFTKPGGHYIVFTGAIIFGGIRMAKGLFALPLAKRRMSRVTSRHEVFNDRTIVIGHDADDKVEAAEARFGVTAGGNAKEAATEKSLQAPAMAMASSAAEPFDTGTNTHSFENIKFGSAAGMSIASLPNGAVLIDNMKTLCERTSLLAPELGLGDGAQKFGQRMFRRLGEDAMKRWLAEADDSAQAIMLIRRFGKIEGSTTLMGLNGPGRASSADFARFGGLLNEFGYGDEESSLDATRAVERCIQASYLAMLMCSTSLAARQRNTDMELVWDRWMATAYSMSHELIEVISEICAFDAFWERALRDLGVLRGNATLDDLPHELTGSLAGLMGVGAALTIAERG